MPWTETYRLDLIDGFLTSYMINGPISVTK
uniref:Uncharacterized protein n=1 Tax=Arundo donax TaxID=35708 RepID=A0A0A9A832_ARUDO